MTTGSSKWNLFIQTLELVPLVPQACKGVRATAETDLYYQGFLSFLTQILHVSDPDGIFIL